ncbi:hypothetical protein B0T19DRAFT_398036 [Cercophora scortea]|uniref:Uncharacterized protein n=1 Tax=Cercophora scortea TaxID=314031 RepID=A0AAE0IVX4_9PEZI|nr:hypothetical protein B0T19DRAFT_398036 [Cercophora scortea]
MPPPWRVRPLGPNVGRIRIVHAVPSLVGERKLTDWIAAIRINLGHNFLLHHILEEPKPAQLRKARYQRGHISVYCLIRNSIQPMIPVLRHAGYDVDGGGFGFEPKRLWDVVLSVVPGSTDRIERLKFDLIMQLTHTRADVFSSLFGYFERVNGAWQLLGSLGISPPEKFIQTVIINGIEVSERHGRTVDPQLLEQMKSMNYNVFYDTLRQFI